MREAASTFASGSSSPARIAARQAGEPAVTEVTCLVIWGPFSALSLVANPNVPDCASRVV